MVGVGNELQSMRNLRINEGQNGGNSVMIFAFVQLTRSKQDKDYSYKSMIQQSDFAGSLAGHKTLGSEEDMAAIMNPILIKNRKDPDAGVMHSFKESKTDIVQYSGLDLTEEEAESLGWKNDKQKSDPLKKH
jgi:hypothetical protein